MISLFSPLDRGFGVIVFAPTEDQVLLLLCFDLQIHPVIMRTIMSLDSGASYNFIFSLVFDYFIFPILL